MLLAVVVVGITSFVLYMWVGVATVDTRVIYIRHGDGNCGDHYDYYNDDDHDDHNDNVHIHHAECKCILVCIMWISCMHHNVYHAYKYA